MIKFNQLQEEAIKTPEYLASREAYKFTEDVSILLAERNISKAELARMTGMSRSYITQIMRGDINFSLLTMAKIAKALNCDLRVKLQQGGKE